MLFRLVHCDSRGDQPVDDGISKVIRIPQLTEDRESSHSSEKCAQDDDNRKVSLKCTELNPLCEYVWTVNNLCYSAYQEVQIRAKSFIFVFQKNVFLQKKEKKF